MEYSDHEQLRRHAYSIWERHGCPSGKDEEIWELAVKEMNGQAAPQVDQGPWPVAQEEREADPTSDAARTDDGASERRSKLGQDASKGIANAVGRKPRKGADAKSPDQS